MHILSILDVTCVINVPGSPEEAWEWGYVWNSHSKFIACLSITLLHGLVSTSVFRAKRERYTYCLL